MNKYILRLAREGGFTSGKHLDTDTTVQESGITYPTEMKLMKKFQQRVIGILGKIFGAAGEKTMELVNLGKESMKKIKEYQFFTETKEKRKELIGEVRQISEIFLEELKKISNIKKSVKKVLNIKSQFFWLQYRFYSFYHNLLSLQEYNKNVHLIMIKV